LKAVGSIVDRRCEVVDTRREGVDTRRVNEAGNTSEDNKRRVSLLYVVGVQMSMKPEHG
jgi:hypothetical protein